MSSLQPFPDSARPLVLQAFPAKGYLEDIGAWPEALSLSLLSELELGGGFRLEIEPGVAGQAALEQIYFRSRAQERSSGSGSCWIGYPVFWSPGRDAGGDLAAPLLFWEASLAPGPQPHSPWALSQTATHQIRVNSSLLEHKGISPEQSERLMRLVSNRPVSAGWLKAVLREWASLLQAPEADLSQRLSLLPDWPDPEARQERSAPQIGQYAVLGYFDLPPLAQLARTNGRARLGNRLDLAHLVVPGVLNPEQATVADALAREQQVWAEGAAGTGKTVLGAQLAAGAVARGGTVLMVSRHAAALREYEQQLEAMGLGPLTFLLRDTPPDKMLLLDLLRAGAQHPPKKNSNASPAHQPFNKYGRLSAKLAHSYKAYRAALPTGQQWPEAVGVYLESAARAGKEVLSTQLNAQDYTFDSATLQALTAVVARCCRLYEETNTLHSPLSALSPSVFLKMGLEEARAFISERVAAFLDKANRLQYWYINRQNAYADQLSAHYEQAYQRFARKATALKDQMAEQLAKFGPAFAEASTGSLKIRRLLSSEAKAILAARGKLLEEYRELSADLGRHAYFGFKLPPLGPADMGRVPSEVGRFEEALQQWRISLREQVQEEGSRLSRKSANPRVGFEQQIIEMEESLDRLLDDINDSGLYHLPLHNKALTIPKRQRYLEEVAVQLEETQRSLQDLDNFYRWQRNWLQLDERSRRLVKALLKTPSALWEPALHTWFLDNLLLTNYESALPAERKDIDELSSHYAPLASGLAAQALSHWARQRAAALSAIRKKSPKVWAWLQEKGPVGPLDFGAHFQLLWPLISNTYPILLMTAQQARSLFGTGPSFDLVIAEESHTLDGLALQHLQSLSDYQLWLSPTGAFGGSLLPPEWKGEVPVCKLQHFYRYSPGDPRAFAKVKTAAPSPEAYWFEQVGGRYDEFEEVNEAEARQVLALLTRIKPTPQRTYPSVGIVCLTEGQRQHLSRLLLGIKQQRTAGVELIQQLERNGLSVLTLDEVPGHHFEVVILSATFGPAGQEDELPGHYHRLDNPEMQQQLQALMGCAKEEFWALSSLPTTLLSPIPGDNLLPYLLYWVRSCASRSTAATEAVLANSYDSGGAGAGLPFSLLQQVQDWLKPFLDPGRVHLPEVAVYGQPQIWVEPVKEGQKRHALLVDGFISYALAPALAWESGAAKALQDQGVVLHHLLSAEWWRNPERAARSLAGAILKEDGAGLSETEALNTV